MKRKEPAKSAKKRSIGKNLPETSVSFDPFQNGVLIFDGGMATEIYRNHVFTNRCFDELNLSMPELIRRIHQTYFNAGAEVLTTNTFGANRLGLEKYGLAERTAEINRTGAAIAREVARQPIQNLKGSSGEHPVWVAGSVGPLSASDASRHSEDERAAVLAEQVNALWDGGVDFILFETLHSREEILTAVRAMKIVGDLPFILSAAPPSETERNSAETWKRLFAPIPDGEPKPFAVGLNCGLGPAEMIPAVKAVLEIVDLPLVVQPNAGLPKDFEGRQLYYCSPEFIATYAMEYLACGVGGIGGCCGTTADHIAEIVKMVKPLSKGRQAKPIVKETAAEIVFKPESPLETRSKLARKLVSGEWIETVELIPPCGYDLAATLEKTRKLADHGIDAVNLPDGPRASSRIANIAVAERILHEVGLEPILHFCCRDKNLIGMQSDLLACALYQIRNILFITGDPPKLGNYPDATGVFDTDSIGLCAIQKRLNGGIDLGGLEISPSTDAVIGVGLDPTALDHRREIERFRQKIEAGADFAITQPVFDPDALLRFLDEIGEAPIPIIGGVWPLTSYRNAVFMGNEVPGVVIPDEIMTRMEKASAGPKEDQLKVGIEIAQSSVERIRSHVAGVQVSAPFGRIEISLDVMGK